MGAYNRRIGSHINRNREFSCRTIDEPKPLPPNMVHCLCCGGQVVKEKAIKRRIMDQFDADFCGESCRKFYMFELNHGT